MRRPIKHFKKNRIYFQFQQLLTISFMVSFPFMLLQLSLFEFSPRDTLESIYFINFLNIILNLIAIYSFFAVFRVILGRYWLAILACYLSSAAFSFANFKKLALTGEAVTLSDLLGMSKVGLLAHYVDLKDILCASAGIVALILFRSLYMEKHKNQAIKTPIQRRMFITPWMIVSTLIVACLIFSRDLGLEPFLSSMGVENMTWDASRGNYARNGVFLSSLLSVTRDIVLPPAGYSKEHILSLLKDNRTVSIPDDPKTLAALNAAKKSSDPISVIIYMMEAFWDPQRLNITFNRDPIPVFHQLQQEGMTGNLVVPVFGGGTANTEFEVLTGMSNYFQPSDLISYVDSVKSPVPSLAWLFESKGYRAVAAHNYNPTFYQRYRAYPFLGFEHFYSLEEMGHYHMRRGYPTDEVLVNELTEILADSQSPQFIHAVTMESHGPFSMAKEGSIAVIKSNLPQYQKNQVETYANSISYADQSLGQLIRVLSKLKRRVVLLAFGDHLPALGTNYSVYYDADYISSSDPNHWSVKEWQKMRSTPLAVWSNFPQKHQELGALSANCMAPLILKIAGVEPKHFYNFCKRFCSDIPIFSPHLVLDSHSKSVSVLQKSELSNTEDREERDYRLP